MMENRNKRGKGAGAGAGGESESCSEGEEVVGGMAKYPDHRQIEQFSVSHNVTCASATLLAGTGGEGTCHKPRGK